MSTVTNPDPDELESKTEASELESEIIKTKKKNKFYPGLYHIFVFDEMGSKQELHFADSIVESQKTGIKACMPYNGSYVVTHVCYNSKFEGNRDTPSDNLARLGIPDDHLVKVSGPKEEMIAISKAEYDNLKKSANLLNALRELT